MARHRHPFTVGLPFEDWPDLDRQSWTVAFQDDDLLSGRGAAASWRAATRTTARKAYGRWLRFLSENDRLGHPRSVGDRLSEDNLRAFIAHLRAALSPNTVLTALRYLSSSIAVMDPAADRSLLKLALSRLSVVAQPVRNKSERLMSPVILFQLGTRLMADWQTRSGHDPRLNAMDYRDGLMIAFLALCPIRLKNLAAITIGKQLTFDAGRPRLSFAADEMKGHRPLEFDVPIALREAFAIYIRDIHPQLYAGGVGKDAPLWPSLARKKPRMTEQGIYTRITQVTEKHLGQPVSPHLFRDAAATFITELTPEQAALAGAVLQHRNLATTVKHYIHGQQHSAARAYHLAIDAIIRDTGSNG